MKLLDLFAIATLAILAGCAPVAAPASGPTPTTAASGPPAIPTGAYLGARVNPDAVNNTAHQAPGAAELAQVPAFNASIHGTVKILPVFVPFGDPMPIDSLAAINAKGMIAMIDLACANVEGVTAGTYDAALKAQAAALAAAGQPFYLRWYWEMNHADTAHTSRGCDAAGNGPAFIAAWRHIRSIFAVAPNVAFVWCPATAATIADYYPRDDAVDWIAADAFDREDPRRTTFAAIFGPWYSQWATHGKPMMIGATGALAADQSGYLAGMAADLPTTFPAIKAVIYFDALGGNGDWRLTGPGLAAFGTLAASPYFAGP